MFGLYQMALLSFPLKVSATATRSYAVRCRAEPNA